MDAEEEIRKLRFELDLVETKVDQFAERVKKIEEKLKVEGLPKYLEG